MKTSDAKMPESTTITLPKSTPGVAELVSGWEDGGEYEVTLRQTASDEDTVTLEVVESDPVQADAMDSEDAAEESTPTPMLMAKKAPKPAVKVRY